MKSPETCQEQIDHTRPDIRQSNETVGNEQAPGQQNPPDNNSNLICKELTFYTNLPYYITSPQPSLPPPPDLTKYESPFDCHARHKAIVVAFCCASTFQSAYTMGAYSVTSEQLRLKWSISREVFNIGISMWAIGFACSPMVLAPFSEINGRRSVFLLSGTDILASILGCALTESFAGMIVDRLFNGLGSSTFATVCGGFISDIFHTNQRNTPMALYSGLALLGNAFSPLICGFIASHVSWRWVFYHEVIVFGIIMILIYFFLNETRGSVLLAQRCTAINHYLSQLDSLLLLETSSSIPPISVSVPPGYCPKLRYLLPPSTISTSSIRHMIYLSFTIPFHLLITEPVVFSFSLWISFACALQYMAFSVIPLVFSSTYHFNTQDNGAVFASICVASIVAIAMSIYQELLARKYWPNFNNNPENRLRSACVESILLPISLFWFGWTITPQIDNHATDSLDLPCSICRYHADRHLFYLLGGLQRVPPLHIQRPGLSAFLPQYVGRNLPSFHRQMFLKLGFGPAGSLLGGIAVVLTAVPWVLVISGRTIRARSKRAGEIMKDKRSQDQGRDVDQDGATEMSEIL